MKEEHCVAAATPVVLPEPVVPTEDEGTLLDYAMAIAHERELNVLGHKHDSDGAVLRFRSAVRRALRATGGQAVDITDLVTGMSVSVDVSTSDDDAGNRYFGTVTVAQEDPHDKHGLTLLVQDAKPNFTPQAQADARDAQMWAPIDTAPKDGSWIQLWREPEKKIGDCAPLVFGRWHDEYESWVWPDHAHYDPFTERGIERANSDIEAGNAFSTDAFTHWRLLGKPAIADQAKQGGEE